MNGGEILTRQQGRHLRILFALDQDERHGEIQEWLGRKFDPEAFSPEETTRRMKKGLPDWRRMR